MRFKFSLRALSVGSVLFLVWLFSVQFAAWSTKAAMVGSQRLSIAQAEFVISFAQFPRQVLTLMDSVLDLGSKFSRSLLLTKPALGQRLLSSSFPSGNDDGYLLFSGLDRAEGDRVIKLISLKSGEVVSVWRPDWKLIVAKSAVIGVRQGFDSKVIMAAHPAVYPDASIVFNTGFALVKMSQCSRSPDWILAQEFHHSNELDEDGSIWVPSVGGDGYGWSPWLARHVRDDAIAHVSKDGRLLERRSVAGILFKNEMLAALLGAQGVHVVFDPIHLNQISVAKTATKHWEKGDLLLSLRHLSMVLLYRPSEDRVVWFKVGPWTNQHSVAFVGDHEISVLDNNVMASAVREDAFLPPSRINRVMVFNFNSGAVTEPFSGLMAEYRPKTQTAGRAQVLPDGGLFFEETESGRHLRFSKDKLMWSRWNNFGEGYVGALAWSR